MVLPIGYHRGYCATYVVTLQEAIEQQMFFNEHTDFCWAIDGLNEQAQCELNNYLDYEAEKALDLFD